MFFPPQIENFGKSTKTKAKIDLETRLDDWYLWTRTSLRCITMCTLSMQHDCSLHLLPIADCSCFNSNSDPILSKNFGLKETEENLEQISTETGLQRSRYWYQEGHGRPLPLLPIPSLFLIGPGRFDFLENRGE